MTSPAISGMQRVAGIRLLQAFAAFIALAVAAFITRDSISIEWWWIGVGIATLLSAALLEPHFTDPRASLANSFVAIGAIFAADRSGVETLWYIYGVVSILVLVLSPVALALPPSKFQAAAKWFATRFGRAKALGFSALLIEVIRVSSVDLQDGIALLLGLAAAFVISTLDWYRLLALIPGVSSSTATVELAMQPNLLLVATTDHLPVGERVTVQGGVGQSDATVVAQMAHRSGSRLQLVLDQPWFTVVERGVSDCTITSTGSDSQTLGFAAEGSTERSIEVHPTQDLSYGQPLVVHDGPKAIIYQVSSLRLERNAWDNAGVIEPRARAVQVGSLDDSGLLAFTPLLPSPYQALAAADAAHVTVQAPYRRLGVLSGTAVEIGISPEQAREGHLAILGMSGMGKTTIARAICDLMKDQSAVVALDCTGEYSSRLAFDTLPADSELKESGCWVHEPAGDPPLRCRDFVNRMMTSASEEYRSGDHYHRTLLLEEAHAFLPEWNVATRAQSDAVSESCRYILQARKFGLNFIFVSQRTAVISKSALSQCESYIIFRTLDQTSLEYIESVVGKDMRAAASSLSRYQAICVGPAFNTSAPVIVDLDPPPAV